MKPTCINNYITDCPIIKPKKSNHEKAMIYFLKHFKGIAYFLIMLILFQSCVAYNKNTSTIEEASSDKEMPIQIITKDGNEYKLRWIEEKDDNIFSIMDTKREHIDKNDIVDFVIFDPEPKVVSLELALKNQGTVRILTRGKSGIYNTYEYLGISESDELITGYKMTGKDTLTFIIPIDQIEKIHIRDKMKSSVRTAGLVVGVGLVAVLFVGYLVGIHRLITGEF